MLRRNWLWITPITIIGVALGSIALMQLGKRSDRNGIAYSDDAVTEAASAARMRPGRLTSATTAARAPSALDQEPDLSVEGDKLRLRLRIAGSTAGATHHALADSNGIAINLPQGEALLPIGRHELDQIGFQSVWIRKRSTGTQVRLFFASPEERAHAIHIDPNQITFELQL